MYRIIFLFLFLFTFSNAEYLLTLEQSNNNGTLIYCIKDYSYSQNLINYVDLDDLSHSLNTLNFQSINIAQGYTFLNDVCSNNSSKSFKSWPETRIAGLFLTPMFTSVISGLP